MRVGEAKIAVDQPPLRERGRGIAERWKGRKRTAACGIEQCIFDDLRCSL